jgi:hypothetical protein
MNNPKKLYETENFYVGYEQDEKKQPLDNNLYLVRKGDEKHPERSLMVFPVDGKANTERTFNIACRTADLEEAKLVPYQPDVDGGIAGLKKLK